MITIENRIQKPALSEVEGTEDVSRMIDK